MQNVSIRVLLSHFVAFSWEVESVGASHLVCWRQIKHCCLTSLHKVIISDWIASKLVPPLYIPCSSCNQNIFVSFLFVHASLSPFHHIFLSLWVVFYLVIVSFSSKKDFCEWKLWWNYLANEINTLVAESIVILWYLVLWLVFRSSRADLKYTIVPRVMITGWYYCMVILCNSPFVFEH